MIFGYFCSMHMYLIHLALLQGPEKYHFKEKNYLAIIKNKKKMYIDESFETTFKNAD